MKFPLLLWEEVKGKGVIAGFTGSGPDASRNMALHAGGPREEALENRKDLCRALNLPFQSYTCADQVHGTNIAFAGRDERGRGRLEREDALPGTDAILTDVPDILLNIFVADCVPVILYDGRTGTGGLCHGGWRGTIGEIVPRAVGLMGSRFGAKPEDILALIGPSIGGCCYEVGTDVAQRFRAYPFRESPLRDDKGRIYLDLKKANGEMLLRAGLREANITLSPLCTVCGDYPLFSYRRQGAGAGRFSAFFRLPL